jgi:hypothetical protein
MELISDTAECQAFVNKVMSFFRLPQELRSDKYALDREQLTAELVYRECERCGQQFKVHW